MIFFCAQLYGEYREHPGGSQRREATLLLMERQRKIHGHGHHHHGHHHHSRNWRSHSRSRHHSRHRVEPDIGSIHGRQEEEQGHTSSFKKRRSYSKCRGQEQRALQKPLRNICEVLDLIGIVMFSQTVWLEYRSSSSQNWEKTGSFWSCWVLPWH